MTYATDIVTATAGTPTLAPPVAAWDLLSFFTNAKDYGTLVGGGLISLLGLIVVIVATVFIAKKFFGDGRGNDKSWVIIIIMMLVGGAMLFGGISLVTDIASGGQKTIEELGGGTILLGLGR